MCRDMCVHCPHKIPISKIFARANCRQLRVLIAVQYCLMLLPHVSWPLVAVHFEVEPAGIAHRAAVVVPPPQRGLGSLAVGAPRVRPDQHLAAVILRKYFSLRKYK